MKKIGIIGVGHLGSAVLEGLIKSQHVKPAQLYISGGRSGKAKHLAQQLGCHFCADNQTLAQQCDTVMLAVVPRLLPSVLAEIAASLSPQTVVVSFAASFTLAQYYAHLPASTPVVRAIPNLPAAVCQGMTAITAANTVSQAQQTEIEQLFSAIGKIAVVDESKLDISITVAGCSPAYVSLFIEALADAGVLAGLSREEAYLMSEQAVVGTATMLITQQMIPAQLKDGVCSPGGTTIRGIAQLEKYGLRNAVIEAVKASAKIKD